LVSISGYYPNLIPRFWISRLFCMLVGNRQLHLCLLMREENTLIFYGYLELIEVLEKLTYNDDCK
jgi:hypothetical protein